MTVLRLVLVAALAYSLGSRDWVGVFGAAATLAAAELAALYCTGSRRAAARRWKEKHPA